MNDEVMEETTAQSTEATNTNGDGAPSVEAPPVEPQDGAEQGPPVDGQVDVQADLQAEIERLKAESATNLDGWQRARAEFANYKKRVEIERSQLTFLTGVKIIEKMLPVIDDFDRAIANMPDDLKDNGWIEGVTMTRRKLISLLESEGVSVVPVNPGDPFDPTLHEAVMHEDSDQFTSGQIVAELQKGYRVGDRVIRPSLVRVAR